MLKRPKISPSQQPKSLGILPSDLASKSLWVKIENGQVTWRKTFKWLGLQDRRWKTANGSWLFWRLYVYTSTRTTKGRGKIFEDCLGTIGIMWILKCCSQRIIGFHRIYLCVHTLIMYRLECLSNCVLLLKVRNHVRVNCDVDTVGRMPQACQDPSLRNG